MDLSEWTDIDKNLITIEVAATSGNNTLVAAVSGKRIVVVQYALTSVAASTFRFEDGAGGTHLTGTMNLYAKQGTALDPGAATGALVCPFVPKWFATSTNTLLNLAVTGSNVNGTLGYILAD